MSSTDKKPQDQEVRKGPQADERTTKDQVKEKPSGKVVPKGKLYITATMNNTLVTVTDDEGHTVC